MSNQLSRPIHSYVPGPAKGPGVDEIHETAVPSPVPGVSPGKVVVVTVGAISKSCAVFERNSARISSTHDREPSKDRGGRDNVHDSFDQFNIIEVYLIGSVKIVIYQKYSEQIAILIRLAPT